MRHPVRVRMLRCRPPLQSRALSRPRHGRAAAFRADDLWHPWWDRCGSGEPRPHEADCRQALWRFLCLVDPRRRSSPAAVGLEDSLWIGRGKLAKSNADQVSAIRAIIENLSLEVASPDEARAMLALKGGDAVAF